MGNPSLVSKKSDEDQCPIAYIKSKASHIALKKESERKLAREFLKLKLASNKSNLDWWMPVTRDFFSLLNHRKKSPKNQKPKFQARILPDAAN